MKGFIGFIKNHGVVGLAIGFALGQAASNLVTTFVSSIVNPVIQIITGPFGNLASSSIAVGSANIMYGQFISAIINVALILVIVYVAVRAFGLEEKPKPAEVVEK